MRRLKDSIMETKENNYSTNIIESSVLPLVLRKHRLAVIIKKETEKHNPVPLVMRKRLLYEQLSK